MQRYFLLITLCPLFTACITSSTIDRAKLNRKQERAASILSSYKDDKGNTTIIYTKRGSRRIYKLSQPVDSIIKAYKNKHTLDLINPDSASDFSGVYFVANVKKEKGYQRLLLFDKETRMVDTSGLAQEISYNSNLVSNLNEKLYLPIGPADNAQGFKRIRTGSVSFVLNGNFGDSTRKEMYLVALLPQRRKYTRYLLLPATVALDGVTLPFQVFGAALDRAYQKARLRNADRRKEKT